MTYIEKQNQILERLKETDYAIFNHRKNKALDTVAGHFLALAGYADAKTKALIQSMIKDSESAEGTEGQPDTYADTVDSIRALNKIAEQLNLPPFADIDLQNQSQVERCIGGYAKELYGNR
ncbi:MAG: hypothetical protein NC124_03505 [Clostridium sp.]|nr:hypothetical protein [Clostridium sp.]